MTDKPRKRGRKPMAEEDKKQHISLKLSPLVYAFLKSDAVGKYKASPMVEGIIKRSKPFRDWKKRDQD